MNEGVAMQIVERLEHLAEEAQSVARLLRTAVDHESAEWEGTDEG